MVIVIKRFFYFIILILLSSIVYARDFSVVTITDCASPIRVDVTAKLPVDLGEYLLLSCTDNNTFWECPCNNTPIILSVEKNAINNYSLSLSYTAYVNVEHRSGGGGGGIYQYTINATVINNTPITPQNIIPPIEEIVSGTPPQTPPPIIQHVPTQPGQVQNTTTVTGDSGKGFFANISKFFRGIWEWIKKVLLYKIW